MNDNPTQPRLSLRWQDTLLIYLSPTSLRMLALGFSAGLPLLLVLGTLSFRLREAGIDRATIGFLSWVGLAYGFKWVWAPLVDRLSIPVLTPISISARLKYSSVFSSCIVRDAPTVRICRTAAITPIIKKLSS